MKAFVKYALLICTFALALVSCGEQDEGPVASLEVSFAEMIVGNETSQVYVRVSSNQSWELSISDGWEGTSFKEQGSATKMQTFKGSGDKTNVILNLGVNAAEDARTLIVSAQGGGLTAQSVLTQKGTKVETSVDVITSQGGKSASAPFGWMELPATNPSDGRDFIYHNATIEGTLKRNYSLYWDYSNRVAHWVAYPLNAGYKSTGSRPKPEPWGLDPFLSTDEQPVLYSGFGYGNITGGNTYHPDRGHQLPSADRYSGNSNTQTYYSTNMTPQYNGFNTTAWLSVENKVRDWAVSGLSTDTLYVVTGCSVAGSTLYATDNNGKRCTVPTAYFKAVLRYSPSSSITAATGGYMACALWFEHKVFAGSEDIKSHAISIDALEEKIGTDLFVNLPKAIGEDKAAAIEAADPLDSSNSSSKWWWTGK